MLPSIYADSRKLGSAGSLSPLKSKQLLFAPLGGRLPLLEDAVSRLFLICVKFLMSRCEDYSTDFKALML